MKIITWNINGYRAVTGQNASRRFDVLTKENKLFAYIAEQQPDVIALQETKADICQINEELLAPEGYFPFYNSCKSRKGYSGVVTFTKKQPAKVRYGFDIDIFDIEGRVIECIYDDFVHFNIYFPNAQQIELRLGYKLDFYSALYDYIKKNYSERDKIIISGDYNTAHHPIDLARPEQNLNTSGFLKVEREKLDELVEMGFIDSFRSVNSSPENYTWWSNRARARENNVGWRIDYHFTSQSLKDNIADCVIQPQIMGSDHCPVVLQLNI